jgi:hypothetical protein
MEVGHVSIVYENGDKIYAHSQDQELVLQSSQAKPEILLFPYVCRKKVVITV